jgi:hypothetical protein
MPRAESIEPLGFMIRFASLPHVIYNIADLLNKIALALVAYSQG